MKIRLKILIFLLISIIKLFSEEQIISWNVKNNFNNQIYKKVNVELNYEKNIPLYYTIKIPEQYSNELIDLYLSFDDNDTDKIENYKISYKQYHKSSNKSIKKLSAYFIGENERMELIGKENSFFQSGSNLDSFTLSFWIYPTSFSNNEIVLKIGSQYYDKTLDDVLDQSINAKIEDGKLIWEFNNIFSNIKVKKSLVLESFSRLFPEKWSRVELCYDSSSGIIREYINGIEEGVIISTEDGNLDSTILNLKYHTENRCMITIAPRFYGAIDEFYIIKKNENSDYGKYENNSEITSQVVDLGYGGVTITKINPEGFNENNSKIIYYYRHSQKTFDVDYNFSNNIQWIRFDINKTTEIKSRFFQWKVELLPGDNNEYSPKFRGLSVNYLKNKPPSIPAGLKLFASDGKITLKWIMNSEKDLKGYKIYYGTKSRKYFGKDAFEGISPIDIGLNNKFEITGLNKNLIYYFSITAYDDEEHINESEFSDELSERPLDVNY